MMTPDQKKGQRGVCDTVKIKASNEHGYIIINEDDFDDAKHERFDKPLAKQQPKQVAK